MPTQSAPSSQHSPASPPSGQVAHITPLSNTIDLSLRQILGGHIFIITGALQHFCMLELLRQTTLRVIAETVSLRAARDLRDRGLEQFHTLVTPPQALTIRSTLETRLKRSATETTFAFLEALTPQDAPLYLCRHFGVRMMLPSRIVSADHVGFEHTIGFMVPRGPHSDSWFNTGMNSINLWMAIGRVRRGNGLLIFPDVYGQDVRRQGDSIDPDALGTPIDFEMEAGDILVFASDHVHASEVNVTDETRYVLTKRISLGAPRYSPQGDSWVPYDDTRLLGTALEPLASLRSRVSLSYGKNILRAARHALLDCPALPPKHM